MPGSWNPSIVPLHVCLCLLGACAADDDPVERDVTVWMVDASFVDDGLHPSNVEDGWTVTFSRLQVSIGEVTLGGAPLDEPSQRYQIVDLVRAGEGLILGSVHRTSDHPQATVGKLEFAVAPAVDPVAGNVEGAEVERMRGLYSVYVEGTAQRGEDIKRFSWGLTTGNVYTDCFSPARFTDEEPRVTIHVRGDRLFGDDELVFTPFAAADANADGEIEEEELRSSDLTLGDKDLWTWLEDHAGGLFFVDASQCPLQSS